MSHIFKHKIIIEEDGTGTKDGKTMTTIEMEKYRRVECAMKGMLIKSLDNKYTLQLLSIERFHDQWKKLRVVVLDEQTTRRMVLRDQLDQLQWRKSVT